MELTKDPCAKCAKLIRLTSGCDFFPADVEVRRLLIDRLHRLAQDHEHAERMVNHWLDTERAAPKIADIVDLAKKVSSNRGGTIPDGCSTCNNQPFLSSDTGARRCTCARGKWLRARDEEYFNQPCYAETRRVLAELQAAEPTKRY